MTVDVFTFCDFAQDNNGKFTIIGTYNILTVAKLPAYHQNFYLAMRITFLPEEKGDHIIKFTLENKSTGEDLLPSFELKTRIESSENRNVSINFPINAPMIRIEKVGTYVGSIYVDGELKQSTELYIQIKRPI